MNEKLRLLTDLIKLAKCDHQVREQEYNFLLAIAKMLAVDKKLFDHLFEEYIECQQPESEFERILQFHRLVLLTNIDKEASKEEILFLKDIAIKMGLNPMATETVLSEMNNYPDKIIPPNRLIDIFREQYN